MKRNIIITTILIICAATVTQAAVPQMINYQGYLKESGVAVSGTKNITFTLYNASSGGTQLCTSGAQAVVVTNGLFSYKIGSSGCSLAAIDWNSAVYLELTVEGTTLTPREQITGSAYSVETQAVNVEFSPTGGIAATNVQNAIAELDSEKLALTGGTLLGDLILSGNVTAATGTITASSFSGDGSALTGVTSVDSTKLALTGGTLSGALTVNSSITATGTITAASFNGDGSALTGITAVDSSKLPLTGGTLSGALAVNANITATGTITAATFSGDGSGLTGITAVDSSKLPLSGGTLSGALAVNANITATGTITAASFNGDGSALTGITSVDSTKLPLTGGTLSGALTVNNNITATGTITAASFSGNGSGLSGITAVDSTKLPLTGGTLSGALTVNDNITATGTITAATFSGDGSGITGIVASGSVALIGDNMTGALGISQSGATPSLYVYQSNSTNGAGYFEITNGANASPAVYGVSNGNGPGLRGVNTGTGSGIKGYSSGNGSAGHFQISNPTNPNYVVETFTDGTGSLLFGNHTGASGYLLQLQSGSVDMFTVDKNGWATATKFFGDGSGLINLSGPGIIPIGSVVAWVKNMAGTPALPDGWVECNGQVLSDPLSPYNGQTIPNLNVNRFLMGGTTSGATGGSTSHSHSLNPSGGGLASVFNQVNDYTFTTNSANHLPPYYTVVWIMRIK